MKTAHAAPSSTQVRAKYPEQALRLLRFLRSCAVQGEGWQRRGVRGWLFTPELTGQFPLCADHLTRFFREGRIVRADVRDAVRTNPINVHRITQAGENLLAEIEARTAVEIQASGEPSEQERHSIYMTTHAWQILRILVARDPDDWVSTTHLTSQARIAVYTDDALFLLSRGLIERKKPTGMPTNAAMLHRATSLGRNAEAIDESTSTSHVHVHIPGLPVPEPFQGRSFRPAKLIVGG
jgi:hypothetical protein